MAASAGLVPMTKVGRTENVQNCLDPDFAKCFTVDYMFELVQKLTSTPPSESAVGDGETENGKRKNHDNRGTNEMVEFKISGEGVQLMGFHHYEDIWVPHIGEKLRCQYVKNEGIIAFQGGIKRVGSVKKELANLPGLKMLLDNGGRLEAIVQRNDPKDKIKKWKRVNIEVLQNNLTSTPPSESAVGDGETENGKRKNHDNGPPLQTQHVKLTEGINARLCQCISGDWEVFFIQLGLRKVKIQQLKKERKDEKESVLIFHALEMLRDVRINRDGCYLDDLLMSASKSPKLVDVDWDEIQSQVLPYLKIFCTSSKPVT
ncbi:hypothetical protein MAR_013600 [Mya arenaria]|uniref:C2 domain-containing protein n=1 Tax=Mya arenaria TaxID=6604 RepID=A0ABY7G9I3_MYAAR|nr:hypothetical protein MAR_013600 [Mya arenaria]